MCPICWPVIPVHQPEITNTEGGQDPDIILSKPGAVSDKIRRIIAFWQNVSILIGKAFQCFTRPAVQETHRPIACIINHSSDAS